MVRISLGLGQHLTQQLDLALQASVDRHGRVVLKGGRLRFWEPVGRLVGGLEGEHAVQLGRVDGIAAPVILGRTHAPAADGVEQGGFRAAAGFGRLVQRQRHRWFLRWSVPVGGVVGFGFRNR